MSSLRLRVRSKQGVSNLTVEGATPLIKFAQSLEESTKIPVNQQKFLSGYPPTSLSISAENQTVPISGLFKTGDVITVEEGPPSSVSSVDPALPQTTHKLPPPVSSSSPPYYAPAPASKGTIQFVTEGEVVRRKIADDNSCLFNAVGYAIEGEISKKSSVLRSLVAHIVTMLESDDYDEAVLGKTKQDYASWIMQPNSWGGGIELSILSKEYKTEICAYDVLTKIPYCYGEGNDYSQRVYLVYDGIHYDTLTINLMAGEGAPRELDISVFNPNDSAVNSKMAKFIASLNKAGQYTDTATFQILCGDCNKVLTGEKEMAMHAATTGHTGFQEIKK